MMVNHINYGLLVVPRKGEGKHIIVTNQAPDRISQAIAPQIQLAPRTRPPWVRLTPAGHANAQCLANLHCSASVRSPSHPFGRGILHAREREWKMEETAQCTLMRFQSRKETDSGHVRWLKYLVMNSMKTTQQVLSSPTPAGGGGNAGTSSIAVASAIPTKGVFSSWKVCEKIVVARFGFIRQLLFNHGVISLKRFVSSFTTKLCN